MIPVTRAYLPNKEKLLFYINQIYDNCQLTNYGPLAQMLEKRLAEYLGVKNLILVANGTLALQVAYKSLNIQGSAITTPFSFPATTSSLVWEGIKPIFVDINPLSWNINAANIERHITRDTTAIVPTHIFGNACDVETIQMVAENYNLKVIYDGAHAFGVQYKDKSLLNWGHVSTISFHATKLFHTIEGGAIVTNDDELAKKIRLLINFGIEGSGNIVSLGINAKLNEFEAAMGLCVLDELDNIKNARQQIWTYYYENLNKILGFQFRNKHSTNNYSHCPVLFKDMDQMLMVKSKLNEHSVFPRRYFYPSLATLPYITQPQKMLIAHEIASSILCLPIYPGLDLKLEEMIIDLILKELTLTTAN